MLERFRQILVRRPVAAFFLLTFGVSWVLWLPLILGRVQGRTVLDQGALFPFLGSFGPFTAALALSGASDGKAGVRALLGRLLRWRVGAGWYLVALYGFLVLGLVTVLLFGVASPQRILSELPLALLAVPLNGLTIFLVLGPLGEELGWRGYALPRLMAGRSALAASAILGLFWALWHAPSVLGLDRRGGLSVGAFLALYLPYIVALSVIFTWVYNRAGESVLLTMVLHGAFNYTVFFLNRRFGVGRYDALSVLGITAGAIWSVVVVLIAVYGPDLGSRRPTT